jgi:D-alanyl-D-alanine carboxypeptidase
VKRRFLILMLCILLLVPFPVQAAEPDTIPGNESVLGGSFVPSDAPEITGTTAIVMDMDTGDILYEKDCHKRAEPASTTKLLTAILAVDNLNPSDVITVKDGALEGISYDAVRIWLSPGETMPVSDLLYALLLPSANDAANVLAMAVAGTIPNFATKMNETAKANVLRNRKAFLACYDDAGNKKHWGNAWGVILAYANYVTHTITKNTKTAPERKFMATSIGKGFGGFLKKLEGVTGKKIA